MNKYVVLDQGGELYKNLEVCKLFKEFGYESFPTGDDALHQSGPVKRVHCTIAQSVKAILIRAGLDIKFWPYAFHHVTCLWNTISGQGQMLSPFQ